METLRSHQIFDLQLLRLIEVGDQINRALGTFLKFLSKYTLGLVTLLVFIPAFALVSILSTIVSRIVLEYVALALKRLSKRIDGANERSLMEELLIMEELNGMMKRFTSNLNGKKIKRIYFTIFFGSSWSKCMRYTKAITTKIEQKVYPDLNRQPDEDQIKRLLLEYAD